MRILFIGRFQPFHKGHLEVLRHLKDIGDVIVAIGSAQYGSSFKNPFTYEERERIIKVALEEAGLNVLDVVPVTDIHDHKRWARHVRASVPEFDAIFTNSEVDRKLFAFANERLLDEWHHERETYKGTLVRDAIASGLDWKDLVPPSVVDLLTEMGTETRLRDLKEKGPAEDIVNPMERLN